MTSPALPSVNRLSFGWLIRLRWAAVAAQLATIAVVQTQGAELPLAPLLGIIGLVAASNLGCTVHARRGDAVGQGFIAAVMAFDVLALTGLLYFTGGPQNPFSFAYLVQIALAAVMLAPRWTWFLVGLSLAGSAVLFIDHWPFPLAGDTHEAHMNTHLRGMWVSFGVCAAFIVYFLLRVTRALAEREAELAASRAREAKQERLAALATLAGGAAHELATPLSTIALVARELERALATRDAEDDLLADTRLVRTQVERCRAILQQLATDAGATTGEAPAPISPRQLVADAIAGLDDKPELRVECTDDALVTVPARALAQALRGLIKNAGEASPAGSPVEVRVTADATQTRFAVLDHGPGIDPSILARVGEPFFTTKPPGSGMGLGLFLARTIVERLGGALELESVPGQGTTARATIPRSR